MSYNYICGNKKRKKEGLLHLTTKIAFSKSHIKQGLYGYLKRLYLSLHIDSHKLDEINILYIHNLALLNIVIYNPVGKSE